MYRLFAALRPPPAIRAALAETMSGVPFARWQDDEQLHVTLRFIGEVDGRVAEDVALAVSQVHAPAPQVRLHGVGAFEKRGRADTLWAGLSPAEPLAALHRKVDQAAIRCGLPPEGRAFLPHITVARLPRRAGAGPEIAAWRARHAALSSDPFALTHLVLYRSHLGAEGARYETIARWPLG